MVWPGSRTFRIDFSDLSGGFDLLAVANVPTDRKAGELKVDHRRDQEVYRCARRDPRRPQPRRPRRAILHPGYRLRSPEAAPIRYGRDVAALIMIDTPNQGSRLAFVSGFPKRDECILADTVNLRELQPTSSFLQG